MSGRVGEHPATAKSRTPEGPRTSVVSTRATSAVLTIGSLISAGCFMVAIALEVLGRPTTAPNVLDLTAVISSMAVPEPWGWATLGVVIVIVTPAVGLLTTVLEYRGRREAWLALGVLGILALSLGVALLR